MHAARIHYGHHSTTASMPDRYKISHHHAAPIHAARTSAAYEAAASGRGVTPTRAKTPIRSTTPHRTTGAVRDAGALSPMRSAQPSTPVRQTMHRHTAHAAHAATVDRYAAMPTASSSGSSGAAAGSSSTFMTQAARGDVTPRNQTSRPSAAHAHTAPLRRGPSLLPSTPLQERQLLVLDMDETLLHADVSPVPHDISFVVRMDNGSSTPVYVKFRPHLDRFLAIVSRLFEVVVFTASISRYANQVLDYIDPSGSLIHHRLYREHCTETNGSYVKDLERLGRPLERISIVDNSPIAYSFHPDNAVAIPSWYDCERDTALHMLLPLLERMAHQRHVYGSLDDIRRELRWE